MGLVERMFGLKNNRPDQPKNPEGFLPGVHPNAIVEAKKQEEAAKMAALKEKEAKEKELADIPELDEKYVGVADDDEDPPQSFPSGTNPKIKL